MVLYISSAGKETNEPTSFGGIPKLAKGDGL